MTSYGEGSTMTDARQVFISYSRDAAPFVGAVAADLRQLGLDPWIDTERRIEGSAGREATADALLSAEVFVVFVGATTDSPWMNFEIGAAIGREKPVVPVYLTEPGKRNVPSVLAHFASVEAHDQKPDEVAKRIADIIRGAQRPQPV